MQLLLNESLLLVTACGIHSLFLKVHRCTGLLMHMDSDEDTRHYLQWDPSSLWPDLPHFHELAHQYKQSSWLCNSIEIFRV